MDLTTLANGREAVEMLSHCQKYKEHQLLCSPSTLISWQSMVQYSSQFAKAVRGCTRPCPTPAPWFAPWMPLDLSLLQLQSELAGQGNPSVACPQNFLWQEVQL